MTPGIQRTPRTHWLPLWMMAFAIGIPLGIINFEINEAVRDKCADGNSSGFAYGADFILHSSFRS